MKYCKFVLLALIVASCGTRPSQQVYVLGTPGEPAAGVRDDTGRRVIEVKRVLVPDYLDNTDITLRTGASEVTPSQTGAWGERLSTGFTQALAGALAKRVPAAVVVARPPVVRPAVQVLMEVTGMQAGADGEATLSGRWTILRLRDGSAPQTIASAQGNFVAHGAGSGDAAVVAAINDLIDQIADRLALSLR